MKRRLVNIGIFSRTVCSGRLIDDDETRNIYAVLKAAGFTETRWQLIYDGQIGGLVFPYNRGLTEIHVRFYADRIFAELEYSRSSAFHFVFPLYNASNFLAGLLKERLAPQPYQHLLSRLRANLRDDEAQCPHWRPEAEVNPFDGLLRNRKAWKLGSALHRFFGWRALAIAGFIGIPLALPMHKAAWALIAIMAVVSMRFIPSTGRP